jgi:acetyl esterase/lipase
MMRRVHLAILFLLVSAVTESAAAQTISASGDPDPLTVTGTSAGLDLAGETNSATTLSITTSATNQKIVARLQSALPAGVTLTLNIAAPSGATSLGPVTLTTSDKDIVTGIPLVTSYSNLAVTYALSSSVAGVPVPTTVRTVLISVVNGS